MTFELRPSAALFGPSPPMAAGVVPAVFVMPDMAADPHCVWMRRISVQHLKHHGNHCPVKQYTPLAKEQAISHLVEKRLYLIGALSHHLK